MKAKKAKKAIRKVTKKVAKRATAKPRRVKSEQPQLTDADLYIRSEQIMRQVRELVEATAMNGGITTDNESKLSGIEGSLRIALNMLRR